MNGIKEPSVNKVLTVQTATMLIGVIAMFIDSIIVSLFLRADALAAYGFTMPVILLITAFGGMIGNGVQVLAGESSGAGDTEKMNRVLSTALAGGGAGAVLLMLLILLLPDQTAVFLGARSAAVTAMTASYLKGLCFAFPMIVAVLTVPVFMQLDGGRPQLLRGAILLIVLDLILDLLNVTVIRGGMFGMAMATSLSYWAVGAYNFFSFFRRSRYRFSFAAVSGRIMKDIFRFGMLYLTYKMCQVILSYAINRILSSVGSEMYVAANSIISSVNLVTGALPSGFGSTTTMICSYYYGMGSKEKFSAFISKITKLSVRVDLPAALVCMAAAPLLVLVFSPGSELVSDTAVFGLRVFSLSIVFNTLNYIIKNSCQCVRRHSASYAICVMNDLAMPLAAAAVIVMILPLKWIWASYTIGQFLTWLAVWTLTGGFGKGGPEIWR